MYLYRDAFEEAFLKASKDYYTNESNIFISKNTMSDYMKKVLRRIDEEQARLRSFLHTSSEKELLLRCDQILIENHRDTIWTEFHSLLLHDQLGVIVAFFSINS